MTSSGVSHPGYSPTTSMGSNVFFDWILTSVGHVADPFEICWAQVFALIHLVGNYTCYQTSWLISFMVQKLNQSLTVGSQFFPSVFDLSFCTQKNQPSTSRSPQPLQHATHACGRSSLREFVEVSKNLKRPVNRAAAHPHGTIWRFRRGWKPRLK